MWALGRRIAGERAGLVAGASIVAVNPLLAWFSQEARAYALLVLLAALAALLWLRALERASPARGGMGDRRGARGGDALLRDLPRRPAGAVAARVTA